MRPKLDNSWLVARLAALAVALGACSGSQSPAPASKPATGAAAPAPAPRFQAPPARVGADHDEFHGIDVPDPYRWLEDDNAERQQWLAAQAELSRTTLATLAARRHFEQRLTELWNTARRGLPQKRGRFYFYLTSSPSSGTKLSVSEGSYLAQPRTLRQPQGRKTLGDFSVSPDGRYVAYELGNGSDQREWRIHDVARKRDFREHIKTTRGSRPVWTADSRAFLYSTFNESADGGSYKLLRHRLGTAVNSDRLVYRPKDKPQWRLTPMLSAPWLVLSVSGGAGPENGLLLLDPAQPNKRSILIGGNLREEHSFVSLEGRKLWIKTSVGAAKGRVVEVDLARPAASNWKTIVPARDDVLLWAVRVKNRLLIEWLAPDMRVRLDAYDLRGRYMASVIAPMLGSISGIVGGPSDSEALIALSTPDTPGVILAYDSAKDRAWRIHTTRVLLDRAAITTRVFFCTSNDGTQVPLTVTQRRDLVLDGGNPTLLAAYGGFGRSLTPGFEPSVVAWVEAGGVYVTAGVRGGGEFGMRWYRAGLRELKQNTFDDFAAAAEWLVERRFTRPEQLAALGSSNGGLTVAATLVQRPELFGAALPNVGVYDMLSFHRHSAGSRWLTEYGDPREPGAFAALYSFSPYHNAKPNTPYPATLITTGENDDRVPPWHSYKFAAALQAAQAGPAPILMSVAADSGHAGATNVSERIRSSALRLSFAARYLGMPIGAEHVPPDGDSDSDAGSDTDASAEPETDAATPSVTDAGITPQLDATAPLPDAPSSAP